MNHCLFLLVLGTVSSQLLLASDKPNQQEAINRMQQAVAKTNIFELPSFAMKATVRVDNQGKPVEGTYQLLWNGPEQWREEISLPGYSELQIGGKRAVWVQRSTDFIPFPIHNLRQALGFGSNLGLPQSMSLVQLALTGRDTVKKTHQRKEHGDKLTCFEIENELKHSSEICVNDSSDTIARISSYYEDADLKPVGGKVFPRHLSIHLENKTVAQANVTELSTPAQFPPDTFAPPVGVSAQAGCMNPTLPRLVKRLNPEYPPNARAQHIQGKTATDVSIGMDGIPRIRKVVESPSSDLEAASLRAISQWRYDPALCNGQPVEVETILQVNYTLSF